MRLLSRNSDVISRLLPSESYDIGIAELPIDETAVRLTRFRMRCVAILPPGMSSHAARSLTPALLSGRPVVAPSRTLQTSVRVTEGLRRRRARNGRPSPKPNTSPACAGWLATGAGWSIVDPLSAETFKHLGLVVRDFEPAIHYEIGAFSARDREPSILAQSFLSMLTDKLDPLDA